MKTTKNPALERAKVFVVQAVRTYKINDDIDVLLTMSQLTYDDPEVRTMIENFVVLFHTMEDTFQEYDA